MNPRARIECWLQRIWYDGAPVPRSLDAMETIYRRLARPMDRSPQRPPVPVIVVGNLVAGGSGKTPVVIALVAALAGQGHVLAVISRGYGGRSTRRPRRVRADDSALEVGDEALEIARATGCPVWVGRRRDSALRAAIDNGAELVISDDGLQHHALPRSFEICVVDARRRFGNGRLLPAGPLRQPRSRLAEVDLVLLRGGRDRTSEALPSDLSQALAFELRPGPARSMGQVAKQLPEPPLAVDAVAGIADPEPFFAHLEALGYQLRRHRLADHQPIPQRWLQHLAGPVVTTAKDHARMSAAVRTDLYVVPVRAVLPEQVVHRIAAHVREFLS